MPRLSESTQSYLSDASQGLRAHTANAWSSFTNFALRDNVLEVAVGLILAASFTTLTTSLVSDILLPLLSTLLLARTLDEKFLTLVPGTGYNSTLINGYNTKALALADGAVVLAWGSFVDKVIRFLLVATSLWAIASAYGSWTGDVVVKRQVKCKYCRKWKSEKARRCVNCTSWVDGREEREGMEAARGEED